MSEIIHTSRNGSIQVPIHAYKSKCIHTRPTSAKHVRRGTTRSKIRNRSYLARGAVPLGPRAPRSILPRRPTPLRLRLLLLLLPRVLPVAELLQLRELRRPGLPLRRPRVPQLRGELRRPGLPLRRPRVPLRRWRCRDERLREEALERTPTGLWRRNLWRSTRWRASTWSWVRTLRLCLHKDQVMELVPADWHHKVKQ